MKKTKLILLHGWAVDKENRQKWQPLIKRLQQEEIEAEFLLLPGLSQPLDQVWTLNDYAQWVIKQLPNQPVGLLGHSFGGQLAIRLVAQYPEKFTNLVLIDCSGVRDYSLRKRIKRAGFASLAKVGKIFTKSDLARKVLYKLAGEKDYLQADLILRQTMANMISTDIQDEASRIQVPTLIIWGENDRVTPLWMGQRLARLIKNARIEIISQARHSPHFTHTDEVTRIIAQNIIK